MKPSRVLLAVACPAAAAVALFMATRLLGCGQSAPGRSAPGVRCCYDAAGTALCGPGPCKTVDGGALVGALVPQDAAAGGETGSNVDSGPPEATTQAPPGWHRWSYPPADCAMFVPDDLATVEPLTWESCPFQPEGCTRATSPWADETGGWGYGATISVAVHNGSTYLRAARFLPDYWGEVLLLRDNSVIGAWRYQQGTSMCGGSPFLQGDGFAGMVLLRHQAISAPWIFLGPADTLMASPERTLVYGDPGFADAPNGFVSWSNRILVSGGDGRFSIRDLVTDAFERPWPPGITVGDGDLEDPVAVGSAAYYWLWTYQLSSVWVRVPGSIHQALLKDDEHSYGWFATDGRDAVWIRSTGQMDTNEWQSNELWTSPLSSGDPTELHPKMLASGLGNLVPVPSVGEGWAAVCLGEKDVRLYRISDGLEKRLPSVPEFGWDKGMSQGLMIADGSVWVVTHEWPGSNQVRYITRFDIASLPSP